jgi:hypothetical protein
MSNSRRILVVLLAFVGIAAVASGLMNQSNGGSFRGGLPANQVVNGQGNLTAPHPVNLPFKLSGPDGKASPYVEQVQQDEANIREFFTSQGQSATTDPQTWLNQNSGDVNASDMQQMLLSLEGDRTSCVQAARDLRTFPESACN